MMNDELQRCLPDNVLLGINNLPPLIKREMSEIRLRADLPVSITYKGENILLYKNSGGESCITVTCNDIENFIYRFCRGSVYAYEESIKDGYITRNGIRVGLCGDVFSKDGKISGINCFTSVNIRIPHHINDASKVVWKSLEKEGFKGGGILVVSPPGEGKTTFLRDFAIKLSKGMNIGGKNKQLRVFIIDEREEIYIKENFSGCLCDVISRCPKEKAFELAIRTMSPQVIICDEIGSEKEANIISKAHTGGVTVIASMHGNGRVDIDNRSEILNLVQRKIFTRAVFLKCTKDENNKTNYMSEMVSFYD